MRVEAGDINSRNVKEVRLYDKHFDQAITMADEEAGVIEFYIRTKDGDWFYAGGGNPKATIKGKVEIIMENP